MFYFCHPGPLNSSTRNVIVGVLCTTITYYGTGYSTRNDSCLLGFYCWPLKQSTLSLHAYMGLLSCVRNHFLSIKSGWNSNN